MPFADLRQMSVSGTPIFDAGGFGYNIKSYGAKIDGVSNDTAAFNAAITAAAPSRGLILIPAGITLINAGIDLKGCSVLGAGTNATFIRASGAIVGGMLFNSSGQFFTTVANLTVDGNSLAQYGIDFSNSYNFQSSFTRVQNCTSHGWYSHVDGTAGHTGCHLVHTFSTTNGADGYHLEGGGSGYFDAHLVHAETLSNVAYGYNLFGGEMVLDGCFSTGDGANAGAGAGGALLATGGTFEVTDPWFSSNALRCVTFDTCTGVSVKGGTISDVQGGTAVAANGNLLRLSTVQDVRVSDVRFIYNVVTNAGLACIFGFLVTRASFKGNKFLGQASNNVSAYQWSGSNNCTLIDLQDHDFSQVGPGAGVAIANKVGATYFQNHGGPVTGTGAQQLIAHGLAFTPTQDQIALIGGSATANPFHSAAPDATNIKVTAANAQPWYWATVGG